MKLAQAIDVQVGMVLASPFTTPPYRPFTVKRVWVSADKRHVRYQLTHYGDRWLDHQNLILVPEGLEWHSIRKVWTRKGSPIAMPLHLEQDPEPEPEQD